VKKCHFCAHELTGTVLVCPNCGHDLDGPQSFTVGRSVIVVGAFVVLGVVLWIVVGTDRVPSTRGWLVASSCPLFLSVKLQTGLSATEFLSGANFAEVRPNRNIRDEAADRRRPSESGRGSVCPFGASYRAVNGQCSRTAPPPVNTTAFIATNRRMSYELHQPIRCAVHRANGL
jgi:hypothetical protein